MYSFIESVKDFTALLSDADWWAWQCTDSVGCATSWMSKWMSTNSFHWCDKKYQVIFFWDVTPFSLLDSYRCFVWTYWFGFHHVL